LINKINNKIIRIFNSRLIKIGISLQNTIFDRDVFNNDQIYIDEIDIKKQFSHIFSNNIWGSQESVSGPGSEVVRTEKYRQNLLKLLHKYKLYKIFDAPCGDFNWMKKFLEENNNTFEYLGGDIVSELIDSNIKNYPSYNFLEIDLTSDKFPKADIFHCRDLLFHLSYDNIYKILENFINSEIPYILFSNHESLYLKNIDIKNGGFRYLDFRRPPFNFDTVLEKINDYYLFNSFPKKSYLLHREKVKVYLKNF